jgi:hypothetical protein
MIWCKSPWWSGLVLSTQRGKGEPGIQDQMSNQPISKHKNTPPASLQRSSEQPTHKFTVSKAGPSLDGIMVRKRGPEWSMWKGHSPVCDFIPSYLVRDRSNWSSITKLGRSIIDRTRLTGGSYKRLRPWMDILETSMTFWGMSGGARSDAYQTRERRSPRSSCPLIFQH